MNVMSMNMSLWGVCDRSLEMVSKTFDSTCGNQKCVFLGQPRVLGVMVCGGCIRNFIGEASAVISRLPTLPTPQTSTYCPIITPSELRARAHPQETHICTYRHRAFYIALRSSQPYIYSHTPKHRQAEKRQSCQSSFLFHTEQIS